MNLAEIKNQIGAMTADERLEVVAFISHLSQVDDPAYQAELARRLDAMEAGHKTSLEDLERLHERLTGNNQ